MADATLAELRAVTYKKRDSWWTVLLVDPLAIHLVRLADRWRWVTPNRITLLAFLVGLGSAGALYAGDPAWLVVGAVLYHLAFILDCVDGKLARWRKSGSIIGGWLDFTLDQVRLVICAVALLAGQYVRSGSGDAVLLLMAAVVVFLNMFRYFNGFLMERALYDLRARLDPAGAARRRAPSISDDDPADQPDEVPPPVVYGQPVTAGTGAEPGSPGLPGSSGSLGSLPGSPGSLADGARPEPFPAAADGHGDAGLDGWRAARPDPAPGPVQPPVSVLPVGAARHSPVERLRSWLTARRIRLNVYSGIEFQMAVLIVAPLAGALAAAATGGGTEDGVLAVTVAACVVMVVFELAQTARFLLSARKLLRALGIAGLAGTSGTPGSPGSGTGDDDGDVPVQRPADATESRPTQR